MRWALSAIAGSTSFVFALFACAPFGTETTPGSDDGGTTSDAPRPPVDGAPSGDSGRGRCTTGAFTKGAVVPLSGQYSVEAARFSPDRTTAYLSLCPASTGDKTQCDLYTATFLPATRQFGNINPMPGVSSLKYDAYPTVTPTGEHMLFGSAREGDVHVFVATAKNGSFAAPTIERLPIEPADYTNEPYLLGDGATLYFASGERRSSRWTLYRASGAPPQFGGTASQVPIGGIDPGESTFAPVVTDDELEIFFASDRRSPGSQTGLDIYTASRANKGAPFSPPRALDALSTAEGNDWPTWISGDGCELYTISKTAAGIATLYVSRR